MVPADATASVGFATVDDTAVAGEDYTAVSGTLVFQSGETSGTIEVPIVDDSDVEPDEGFFVTLSDPV